MCQGSLPSCPACPSECLPAPAPPLPIAASLPNCTAAQLHVKYAYFKALLLALHSGPCCSMPRGMASGLAGTLRLGPPALCARTCVQRDPRLLPLPPLCLVLPSTTRDAPEPPAPRTHTHTNINTRLIPTPPPQACPPPTTFTPRRPLAPTTGGTCASWQAASTASTAAPTGEARRGPAPTLPALTFPAPQSWR